MYSPCASLKMCFFLSMTFKVPFCQNTKGETLWNRRWKWCETAGLYTLRTQSTADTSIHSNNQTINRIILLTGSHLPTSPVCSHPSRSIASAVFSGSPRYPWNTFGPLTQICQRRWKGDERTFNFLAHMFSRITHFRPSRAHHDVICLLNSLLRLFRYKVKGLNTCCLCVWLTVKHHSSPLPLHWLPGSSFLRHPPVW